MGYGLGIDLGTTFTAAAVCGDSGTQVVALGRGVVTSSVVFVRPDGRLLTGDAADAAAASDPTRVSRGHKRRLGDPTPIVIGGAAFSPQALLAAQLKDVIAKVTKLQGGPPEQVVLTCPAVWGPYRREQFDEVPRLAGLSNVRIVTEPEAAATHYSVERRLGDGELVAVYDLGGGTFDTTILRARSDGMEILGTPEGIERMGGMDFDESLMAHVDAALDGALSALDPADPESAATLAATRTNCVQAKETLSTEPEVTIRVPLAGDEREVTVSRIEFNEMIRPSVALTTEALHRTINSAGLRTEDLAGVLLAGGSSRIPLVPQAVSEAFGKPVRVSLHPKFTVALGAAAVAKSVAVSAAPVTDPRQGHPPLDGVAMPQGRRMPPAPGVSPVPTAPARRKLVNGPKWLLPATAAAVALLLVASGLLYFSGSGTGETPAVQDVAKSGSEVSDLDIYHRKDIDPFVSIIGSEENWGGTHVGSDGVAAHAAISVAAEDGLRVSWKGGQSAQFYLQSISSVTDVRPFMDNKGAIVVDLTLYSAPTARTTLAVHCRFPCSAEGNFTQVLQKLPIGKRSTVTVPVSCFKDKGLDPVHVNTPFLVATAGVLDFSVERIRWVAGAADKTDSVKCADLQ
ncbi:hypothetical protein GCM10022267_75770 [Lentzea roselyniae]|uniref:ExoP galactose-binding-like domain-containing protein n=2 Tax=Lentzea roselyniae TaxID=531940 RepID=A0ABP7C656_9PSEU